jgi:dTDP-4-amino-4,6-dideoxygalactose transaminase
MTDQNPTANIPVPLLDVARGNGPLKAEFLAAFEAILDHGRFLFGPEVAALEKSIAEHCGAKHAIGCASGSDALLLALMAYGIGPGDEVLCPSFTFFATASAATRLGATPVFVDIDPDSYLIDIEDLWRKITPKTKAIIPVHLFGQCADMDPIMALAKDRGIAVVEDACQSIGAGYGVKMAGAISEVGCLSFYPTKNLGGFGDGGMLTCHDDALAQRLRLFAAHGMNPRYYHQVVGINSRLDTIQAALLGVKLKRLDAWTEARRENAARYQQLFREKEIDQQIGLPSELPGRTHVWNQYTIRVPGGQRDALKSHLATRKIGSEIYYPVALHQQQCYANLGYKPGSLPATESAAAEVLSLPVFPEMSQLEVQTVVEAVCEFVSLQSQSGLRRAA